MTLEQQILAAFFLDLAIGDPRWLPHPVRWIGRFALWLERPMRRLVANPTVAGTATAFIVIASAGIAAWGSIRIAAGLSPMAGDLVVILWMYTTFAARDLAHHSMAVFRPLEAGDLALARKKVSMIVGRDTDRLDEAGITRAAVESVAESTVDGVTAPLFFACLGGPVGAILYRAINTLDSIFGYKTERYLQFGWASARIDDVANYIPARLTAPLMSVAAGLLGLRPVLALRIWLRDGRNHSSPNSGLSEAAMAGALGVQLGGLNYYGGEPLPKPTIGDPIVGLNPRHIVRANMLMLLTASLFLALGVLTRISLSNFIHQWGCAL